MINKFNDNSEKEIADLEELKELYPKEPWRYKTLGILYEKEGKYEQALEFHTWYLKHNNSLDSNSYDRDTDNKPQIEKLNSAIENDPENAVLYCIRGMVYNRDSQFSMASDDFHKAIRLQPNLIMAYVYRALGYCIRKFNHHVRKEVADDLLQALRIDDTISLLHYELGYLYSRDIVFPPLCMDHNKIINCFDKALLYDPGFIQAYRERALTHEVNGNYKAAIDDLTCYLNHHVTLNGCGLTLAIRGDLYYKIGELDKAIEDYGIAIKSCENDKVAFLFRLPEYYEKCGKCFESLNKEAKAKEDFKKAAKLRKKSDRFFKRGHSLLWRLFCLTKSKILNIVTSCNK